MRGYESLKEQMLNLKNWAVIGVTSKKDRYGYKIWKTLKEHGYNAYGVSPNYDEIEGEKIYHSIEDITETIDVVDMVVAPRISIDVLDEIKNKGVEFVFFQPGSYNEEVLKKADELGLSYIVEDCIYATLKAMEN
ncbi:MAG TPA: CoA-binding protein [Soehngenia sp.]|jgi:Predicted CoA-binding protein|nr:CoA-binding protein [Soehngenia sp.]HPP31941.1 CoA-binding protein [Soehngenia sp.]